MITTILTILSLNAPVVLPKKNVYIEDWMNYYDIDVNIPEEVCKEEKKFPIYSFMGKYYSNTPTTNYVGCFSVEKNVNE